MTSDHNRHGCPEFKFNHVFSFLMALAALSAFVDSAEVHGQVRAAVPGAVHPGGAARPLGGGGAERRLGAPSRPTRAAFSSDPPAERPAGAGKRPAHVTNWTSCASINAEREKLGDVRPFCTPVTVVGSDAGNRESLAVSGSPSQGLKDGMCVLYGGDIVGTLQRSGLAGGQVQLVTNKGFRSPPSSAPSREHGGARKFAR